MTTTLYRALDAQPRLLYVGISDGPLVRFNSHSDSGIWAEHVDTIRLERFATRAEAKAAELRAIRTEDPVFNKAGRPLIRWQQWMAAYPNGDPDKVVIVDPACKQGPSGALVFQTRLFRDAMAARGHRSELARSMATGVHRATLHRWRTRPIDSTPTSAHQVAAAAGLSVDELFVRQPA